MGKSNGWIKLYRKFMDWEWYGDVNVRVVFLHCLLRANYGDQKFEGQIIKRGQFITGRDQLSKEVGLSVQQTRTALTKLKSTNELTIKSTKRGTIITVCNYESYQEEVEPINQPFNQQSNQQVTNNQPTTNQQLTTIEERKKIKKNKKERIYIGVDENFDDVEIYDIPSLEDVIAYFESTPILPEDVELEAHKFINHFTEREWRTSSRLRIKNWKRQASTWHRNYQQYNRTKLESHEKPSEKTHRHYEQTRKIFND